MPAVIALGELWMPIEGFDGYEVSDRGRVRRINWLTGKARIFNRRRPCTKGYLQVSLWRDGHRYQPLIHQLVASAFLGPWPDDGATYDVHHKDGDRQHNHADNLEYVPHAEHWWRAWRHSTGRARRKSA